MKYNFDEIIDRSNTDSLKYDFGLERKKRDDLIPLWIADMDFRIPDEVLFDLSQSVAHGIFGYTETKQDYFDAIHHWFHKRFSWDTSPEWLVKTPGVVFAIALAIRAYTMEGEAVMIQQPVYYPFSECILDNRRRIVNNQLYYENGRYIIDFEDMEKQIIKEKVKLLLFCSPQNPTGRVWTREELMKVGQLCLKHGVIVLSDEIHCDFTYPGHKHTVFASLCESFAFNSIICTSPSKTFNIAGLQVSNIFIPDKLLRAKFLQQFYASGYSQLNTLGLVACKSAYQNGEIWLTELQFYLAENLSYVRSFLRDNLPEIKLVEPDGTYLVWLDFSQLGIPYKKLETLITEKAKLWLDGGVIFGRQTALFERINIACPRSILVKAMTSLERAIQSV